MYVPARHAVQAVSPVERATDPAAHVLQVALEEAPTDTLKVPVWQPVHADAIVWPVPVLQVPAAQGVHAADETDPLAILKVPAGQLRVYAKGVVARK